MPRILETIKNAVPEAGGALGAAVPEGVTFEGFAKGFYLPLLSECYPRLRPTAERALSVAALPMFGGKPLAGVGAADLRAMCEEMNLVAGSDRVAVVSACAHVRYAFALAIRRGVVTSTPADGFDPFPASVEKSPFAGEARTLAQFVMWVYLPYCTSIGRVTGRDITVIRRHLLPAWGERPLPAISAPEAESLLRQLKATLNEIEYGGAAYTVNALFALAARAGRISASPWEAIDPALRPKGFSKPELPRSGKNRRLKAKLLKAVSPSASEAFPERKPRQPKPEAKILAERQPLSEAEASRVMGALKADLHHPAAQALLFIMLTGAFFEGTVIAKWDGFDPQAKTLALRSKDGGQRTVWLSASAVALVTSLPTRGRSEWLFHGPKAFHKPIAPMTVRRYFDRVMGRLGLQCRTINDLRATYADFLRQRNVPARTVKAVMGLGPALAPAAVPAYAGAAL